MDIDEVIGLTSLCERNDNRNLFYVCLCVRAVTIANYAAGSTFCIYPQEVETRLGVAGCCIVLNSYADVIAVSNLLDSQQDTSVSIGVVRILLVSSGFLAVFLYLRLFIRTHPEVATECNPFCLIGFLEVDVLLTSVRSVNYIVAVGWVPSGDSIIHYIDHFDLIAYSQCGGNHELCRILRIGCELAVSAQICSTPAFNAVDLTDEIETVLQSRCDRLRSHIFGPHAVTSRFTPRFGFINGKQILTIRREGQIYCFSAPVGDGASTIDADENKSRNVSGNIVRPSTFFAGNGSHTYTRPLSLISAAPIMNSDSSAVCTPPAVGHFTIHCCCESG